MENRRPTTRPPELGPLPAPVRRLPQRLSAERRAVLDRVRTAAAPVTLAELVTLTGRHENTVRGHLAALVRHRLVTRTRRSPSGRGRPAWLYSAGEVGDPMTPSEHAGLAVVLAETLARTNPAAATAATAAGVEWGRRLAAQQPVTTDRPVTPRDRVIHLLRRYGFEPRHEPGDSVIRLTRCPLLDTARAYPEIVCNVHRGIVCGALEATGGSSEGVDLVAFAEPGACLLTVPFSADAGGPHG